MKLLSLLSVGLLSGFAAAAVESDPLPYNFILQDQKCRHDHTRLFKKTGPEYEDPMACYEACRTIQDCHHISVGWANNVWNCMGCNGDKHGYQGHGGFKVYKIQARDDWDFSKVYAKGQCSSGENKGTLTQEQCYNECLGKAGCEYFSVSDMNFDPLGGGTCKLCNSNSFSGSGSSNGYSTTSPAELAEANPLCRECKAKGWGDPHIVTFDRVHYDVHVKGELTFVQSLESDFTIQARTEIVSNHHKGPAVTTGVVVHEDSYLDLPDVQVSLARSFDSDMAVNIGNCPVQLYVDGALRDITTGTGSVFATVGVSGKRITIYYPETKVKVAMDVKIWRNTCHFTVHYIFEDCRCGEPLVGILGQPDPNDDPTNDWHTSDGTPVAIPESRTDRVGEPAYNYSQTWCLENEQASHFTYEPGTSFDFFDYCNPENYDGTVDEILNNPDPELVDKCTIEGEYHPECVLDCSLFGPGGCDEYIDEVQNTDTAPILERPGSSGENSGSQGDPHFRTWKNEHFEYHGQCDMVLAKDPTFANGLGLDVQIRTKLVRFWSYIRSAAIRIGDDILEVQGSSEESEKLFYWVNFQQNPEAKSIGGFPLSIKQKGPKTRYLIDLSSKYPGVEIEIAAWKEFVKVNFKNGSEEAFGNAVGMLGDFKTGTTLARDGVTKMDDFWAFGNEWQVHPSDDMLFHSVEQPQFPRKCLEPEDPRGDRRRRRLDESSVTEEQAEAACSNLTDEIDRKDCVYDILATQDLDMVGAY